MGPASNTKSSILFWSFPGLHWTHVEQCCCISIPELGVVHYLLMDRFHKHYETIQMYSHVGICQPWYRWLKNCYEKFQISKPTSTKYFWWLDCCHPLVGRIIVESSNVNIMIPMTIEVLFLDEFTEVLLIHVIINEMVHWIWLLLGLLL